MFGREARSIYDRRQVGWPRRRQRGLGWVLLLAALALAGAAPLVVYLTAVAMATQQAYQEIFVTPAPTVTVPTATSPPAATPVPAAPPAAAAAAPAPTPTPEVLPEWTGTERLNVLLLGVDTRQQDEVPRSDTMILVSIDPVNKRVGLLSFPRDLWVTIPGHGPDKINAAFPLGELLRGPGGGPALARQTVEYNFRIPVHHFAMVDFTGFIKIVDTVGGIDVEVPYPIKDDSYPADDGVNYIRLYVPAGLQHFDGAAALRYARSRNFDTDFGRQRRQQQVLQAIRDQGLTLDLVPRLPELITALGGAVKTDLDPRQLPALVQLGRGIERDHIRSYGFTREMTIPHETPEIFYLEPAWPKIGQALREMLGGAAPSLADVPAPRLPVVARPPTPTPRPTATPTPAGASTAAARATITASPLARGTAEATPASTAPAARLRVAVRNGTKVAGLAARHADLLRAQGYTVVDVAQDENAGKYPRSIVLTYGASTAQATAVARALGLPASAVKPGAPPAPPGTDILVILGDDAAK